MLKVYDLTITNVFFLWQIPAITKQCFQIIPRTFQEYLFKRYSKDIPGISQCYKNVSMESKNSKNCFVGYPVKIFILAVSSLERFF